MRKGVVLALVALLVLPLGGCASEARQEYEEVLAAKLAKDPDLRDYHLDPKEVAHCVAGKIASELPGLPGSPARDPYWQAHIAFQKAENPLEAQRAIEEAAPVFGSKQKAAQAALSVTSHIMACLGELMGEQ